MFSYVTTLQGNNTQLGTAWWQIKTPVPEIGYILWSWWPVWSHRLPTHTQPPKHYGLWLEPHTHKEPLPWYSCPQNPRDVITILTHCDPRPLPPFIDTGEMLERLCWCIPSKRGWNKYSGLSTINILPAGMSLSSDSEQVTTGIPSYIVQSWVEQCGFWTTMSYIRLYTATNSTYFLPVNLTWDFPYPFLPCYTRAQP